MTARLRELAEDWRTRSSNLTVDPKDKRRCAIGQAYLDCAAELLAILDAEGDGGAVGNADVMVCQIGDYAELDKRAWATVIYDDKKVAECYTNEDAELVCAALRAYSTHPARSGVVSDADVDRGLEMMFGVTGKDADVYRPGMRAALEHFAKGERHE